MEAASFGTIGGGIAAVESLAWVNVGLGGPFGIGEVVWLG